MAFRVSSNGHIYLWLTGVPMCLRGVDNGSVLDLRQKQELVSFWMLSPFLIGRMFLREPSWKYSAKLFGS